MNQVKTLKPFSVLLICVAVLCPSAQARVILGVSGGQSGLSDDLATSIQAKDKQSGAQFVTLGYQLTPPWSVNVRYGVLMDETISNGQQLKLSTGAIIHRYDVLPTSRWDVYGMMGVSYNEQSVSGQITGMPLPAKKELKRVSPMGGVGVGYHVTPRQSVGVEAVIYTQDTWAGTLEYRYRFPNKIIENAPDWQAFEQQFTQNFKQGTHPATQAKPDEAIELTDAIAREAKDNPETDNAPDDLDIQ